MKKRQKPKIETLIANPATSSAGWLEHTKKHRAELRLGAVSLFYGRVIFPERQKSINLDFTIAARIDKGTLERIEKDGLSDTEFFELLRETPLWLISEPFQEKIAFWQATLADPYVTAESKKMAQDRLKMIGTVLAFMGQGHPQKAKPEIIFEYYMMVADFEPVMPELSTYKSGAERERKFCEKLPRYKQYVHLVQSNFAAKSLAKAILEERYALSGSTLKKCLAEGRKMLPENPFIRQPAAPSAAPHRQT